MSEHKFTKLIHEELDKQTDSLSPEVMDELKQARQQALAATSDVGQDFDVSDRLNWWQKVSQQLQLEPSTMMAGASFASVCLVAVLVFSLFPTNDDSLQNQSALAMLDEELSEDMDMIEQIEFAMWLSEAELESELEFETETKQ